MLLVPVSGEYEFRRSAFSVKHTATSIGDQVVSSQLFHVIDTFNVFHILKTRNESVDCFLNSLK